MLDTELSTSYVFCYLNSITIRKQILTELPSYKEKKEIRKVGNITSSRSHIPEEIKNLPLRPHEPPFEDVTYAMCLCIPGGF